MSRLAIITVGKTHSGKTTFAARLEQQLQDSLVIDQDNHAVFINSYYKSLLPQQGPNTLKFTITRTVTDYAVQQTPLHLILCNANRYQKGRRETLAYFKEQGFHIILVHLDIPDDVLEARVAASQKSKNVFRSAKSFDEVLIRQQGESVQEGVIAPTEDEADDLFVIHQSDEVDEVIQSIINIC